MSRSLGVWQCHPTACLSVDHNQLMRDWWLPLFGLAYLGLLVMRVIAGRELRAGNGQLAPFLVGPTVLLFVLPIGVVVLNVGTLGLLAIPIGAFLVLNALIFLRPLVKVVKAARGGDAERVSETMATELGEAMLGSMALVVIAAIAAGVMFVIYLLIQRGG